MREMVFLQKNIAKWENITIAAKNVGLNVEQLNDFEEKAKTLFEEDLKLAKQFGVRGFLTLFFYGQFGQQGNCLRLKPYPFYETAVLKLNPSVIKTEYNKNWETLFAKYHSLTAKEFSELSGTSRNESETLLNELCSKGTLGKARNKEWGNLEAKKHEPLMVRRFVLRAKSFANLVLGLTHRNYK